MCSFAEGLVNRNGSHMKAGAANRRRIVIGCAGFFSFDSPLRDVALILNDPDVRRRRPGCHVPC